MTLSQALLPEFDMEFANTRKAISRVPDNKLTWKPHEKSFSMGELAIHLAEIPQWMAFSIGQSSFDVSPPGGQAYQRPKLGSCREILEMFDKGVTKARTVLSGASDEMLTEPWSLLKGGDILFTMPRIAVVRSFLMNHNIHHRAQLGMYLRLNDIPVPGHYGPSADEGN